MRRGNKVTKSKQIIELEIMLNDMKNVTEGHQQWNRSKFRDRLQENTVTGANKG